MKIKATQSLFIKSGLICLLAFQIQVSMAQLYPGLSGETLADAIRTDYTPTILLNDSDVKDTLYARIFIRDDSVHCIYSDFSRYLPDGVDPSIWLYNDGSGVESMNLEHGWPKSKGADDGTGGSTNMYHLFPSRSDINSDRASHPYGEINDNQTVRWYYKALEMSSPPSGDRSLYSEYINGTFEPRESVKGDIARAMFYFWTIYRADALAADPFYFASQLEDLCLWHAMDPVDEDEMNRNGLIAQFQGGLDNPFIIDCSLVMRAYCADLPLCEPLSAEHLPEPLFHIYADSESQQVSIRGDGPEEWRIVIYDLMGRKIFTTRLLTSALSPRIDIPSGRYIVSAVSGEVSLVNSFYFY